MTDSEIEDDYALFWDDVLREAEVSGEPQQAAFFRLYGELAAENGDCADLIYTPVRKEGRGGFQVDGYALDRDRGELHLAVCDFRTERELQSLNADRMQQVFGRAQRLCENAVKPAFITGLEESSATFELASQIHRNQNGIKRIRCVMFSNARLATRKKTVEAGETIGAPITFNIIDFTRYVDIQKAQGGVEPIELAVNELNGGPLLCLKAHVGSSDDQSYLVVMPGDLLARIYGLYGARLMEQNVRTFLQARTKANKGIINTATSEPEMFFAYNNGITATATEVELEEADDGSLGIAVIKNLQIVNGGQTTASLLYARDKNKADLSSVFVQMKLSVVAPEQVEKVVPLISRFANTQNRISEADFFSSHPFHVEMQQISRRLSAPVAAGSLSATRWFYERARGQYRNEQASRTPAEKRRFNAEFPRSQMIQKTDLAKYHVTFKALPHLVSLGAQKCFLKYAEEISKKWEAKKEVFNEAYFKNTAAKAILFRWTDGMIGKSDWYQSDRGYKANIVTYTLAWLVNYLDEKRSSKIDFEQIWNLQAVPEEFQQFLCYLAPRIAKIVKDPPPSLTNISEYAKTQACWAKVSSSEIPVPDEIMEFTISLVEAKQDNKDAVAIQMIDDDIAFEQMLFNLTGRTSDIETMAQSKSLLSPLSHKALKKVGKGTFSLTKPETKALKNLFARLEEEGVDVKDMLISS